VQYPCQRIRYLCRSERPRCLFNMTGNVHGYGRRLLTLRAEKQKARLTARRAFFSEDGQ
jgi:hypothetical protein